MKIMPWIPVSKCKIYTETDKNRNTEIYDLLHCICLKIQTFKMHMYNDKKLQISVNTTNYWLVSSTGIYL